MNFTFKNSDNIIETEVKDDNEFIELASSLGNPIKSRKDWKVIDTLISLHSKEVEKDSLSKRYWLESFPIHTDCAYLSIPPKYILLRYIWSIKNPSPTIVIDFDINKINTKEMDFLTRKIRFVKGSKGWFYSPILKDNILRYDEEVMRMVSIEDNKMNDMLSRMKQIKINRYYNKVAIIRNHETLHYRPSINPEEHNKRVLQRINIL